MKTFTKTMLVVAVATCGIVNSSSAQSPHGLAMELQRVRQQLSGVGMPHATQNPVRTMPVRNMPARTMPTQRPQHTSHPHRYGNPSTYPTYSQYPVYVSPNQFNGINPYTGGVNTKNEQVDNTYYDHHRETSKQNGTRRWVRRPIYDTRGNIKGYQEGYVWRNSVTGVEHGELKNVTSNDKGGVHEQIQVKAL